MEIMKRWNNAISQRSIIPILNRVAYAHQEYP